MNQQKTYMGSSFYDGWKRATLSCNHPLSPMLRANPFHLYPITLIMGFGITYYARLHKSNVFIYLFIYIYC